MKLPVRILLSLLCAAMVLAMPFVVSSPRLLDEPMWEITEILDAQEEDAEEDWSFLPFLNAVARAEDEEEADVEIAGDAKPETKNTKKKKDYSLPMDFSGGTVPNPAGFTENGYEDASISVKLEKIKEDGVIYNVAWVKIASPTQLRTAIANENKKNPMKSNSTPPAYITKMVPGKNAIVAMNGDHYLPDKDKHCFEIRMGFLREAKANRLRDVLIIDEQGNFHIFLKSKGAEDYYKKNLEYNHKKGGKILNAFMFGPALVVDGKVMQDANDYGLYNVKGKEPRSAIGQIDTLSYVMVVADGRNNDSAGATCQMLADFMGKLGCKQAYNMDGGNTALMVVRTGTEQDAGGNYIGTYAKYSYNREERDVPDMIYFASAVPQEEWKDQ